MNCFSELSPKVAHESIRTFSSVGARVVRTAFSDSRYRVARIMPSQDLLSDFRLETAGFEMNAVAAALLLSYSMRLYMRSIIVIVAQTGILTPER